MKIGLIPPLVSFIGSSKRSSSFWAADRREAGMPTSTAAKRSFTRWLPPRALSMESTDPGSVVEAAKNTGDKVAAVCSSAGPTSRAPPPSAGRAARALGSTSGVNKGCASSTPSTRPGPSWDDMNRPARKRACSKASSSPEAGQSLGELFDQQGQDLPVPARVASGIPHDQGQKRRPFEDPLDRSRTLVCH